MTVTVTVLTVPSADAELAADRLTLAGAFAVEERQSGRSDVELRAVLGDDIVHVAERLGALPDTWLVWCEQVDEAPLDTWREFARPITIARDLVLRPAWLAARADAGVIEVAIEPGASFGLGDHPTTRASAAAVWRCVSDGDRVLDVGCGSGVLAIAAVLGGAAHAVGIDVAEPAVVATRHNAQLNGVAGSVSASTTELADVDGQFELVVANILAPTLIALAGDLCRVTAPGGTLIISGILANAHAHVLAALAPMRAVTTDVVDGWAAVELRHPAG